MAELVPCTVSKPHIVLFPFMAKGHTIPLLHLARLLVNRGGILVSVFTTPANHMFIADSLTGLDVTITDLPFPDNLPEIPPGVESTDKLPSMSLFKPFVNGLKLMQPIFEEAIQKIHSQVSCIISDGFLHWTLQSAMRFGIPRLSYFGLSNYATAILHNVVSNGLLISSDGSPDEPFAVPGFPWIQVTRYDCASLTDEHVVEGPYASFTPDMVEATENSYGMVQNSFYELEPLFADHVRLHGKIKIWNVGPLCHTRKSSLPSSKNKWIRWLDKMLAQNRPVVYVAFGSQAAISPERLHELVFGLEQSKVNFLWVLGKTGLELESIDGFETRVKGRGLIVKEWVDQREILEHEAVQGFFSHCGWNSVVEGICAKIPILAWPMLAEQSLNAIMVSEEIKVGLRVKTVDGSTKGYVTGESLRDSLIELMEGEKRKDLVENVKRLGEAARRAVADGGSSSNALDKLIEEVHTRKRNELI